MKKRDINPAELAKAPRLLKKFDDGAKRGPDGSIEHLGWHECEWMQVASYHSIGHESSEETAAAAALPKGATRRQISAYLREVSETGESAAVYLASLKAAREGEERVQTVG